MRSNGDVPRLSTFGTAAGDREPGSDVPLPPCSCDTIAAGLTADQVAGLDDDAVLELIAAQCSAAMHYCEAWPDRRRELRR